MADFDSKLPIRSLAADNTTKLADSTNLLINPSTEDTQLLVQSGVDSINTSIDVALSTRARCRKVSAINGKLNSLGQKTMANSVPVVIASDQSVVPVSGTVTTATASKTIAYNTAAAVAAAGSNTHSFTPAGAIKVHRVIIAGSGKMKAEIQYSVTAAEV